MANHSQNETDSLSFGETQSSINQHDEEADLLRRRLKFFFMNPCEKWKAKRRFPWKLGLQLVKIILVTTQLALFGFDRGAHVDFLEKSEIAFRHLFLQNWDATFETMPYPPATGAFAVYTIPKFYDSVNYAQEQYNKTEGIAVGTYHFSYPNDTKPPMKLVKTFYKVGKIHAHNQTYVFDDTKITDTIELHPIMKYNESSKEVELVYDVEEYLRLLNKSINFDSIIQVELKFSVKTVHLRKLSNIQTPDCFQFFITITYDNSLHNGQMTIHLASHQESLPCHGNITSDVDEGPLMTFMSVFDAIVIVVSFASCLLCCRSLVKGQRLRKRTEKFFRDRMNREMDFSTKLEFLNLWYIMIVTNDIMTIIGSVIKIQIENKSSHEYEACGVLLGTGNLLVWFGVLRYLGFFEKYNILILTMKKSAPNILRFLVCAGVFYFGFAVCGWVVLGPYHLKFRSLSSSMETLFSLIDGDEIYITFSRLPQMHGKNGYIWWFGRVYIYSYVSLFIYVVINLFLTVILDSYSTIKFRTLSTASENLFALVNGDELFVTFATISNQSSYVWWYSRIYLYVFISLFIYMVLNLFIAVIMDTYETIKDYYKNGFPKSELQEFYSQNTDSPHELFVSHGTRAGFSSICLCGWLPVCIAWCSNSSCCRRTQNVLVEDADHDVLTPNEATPLIS